MPAASIVVPVLVLEASVVVTTASEAGVRLGRVLVVVLVTVRVAVRVTVCVMVAGGTNLVVVGIIGMNASGLKVTAPNLTWLEPAPCISPPADIVMLSSTTLKYEE